MSVSIKVAIPAGEIEVNRSMHGTLAENGTENLAETLRDACNAVLRSYGLPPAMTLSTARLRLVEESKRPTPRGGW